MASKRDLLLGATTLDREVVPVPELGPDVSFTVQGMSGFQRDKFESSLLVETANGRRRKLDTNNVRAKLLVQCLIDEETGTPLFRENDVSALGNVSARILERLFPVAQKLSGISDADIEEISKNSASTGPSSDSPSS